MKYQSVNIGHENGMRLQSIGVVLGTPASEIKTGDFLMWNFGHVYKVNGIIKETEKTVTISTSPEKSEKVFEQKLLKTRLVCILQN